MAVGVPASLVVIGYFVLAIWFVPKWAADGVKSSKPEAQAAAQESERASVRTAMLAVLAGSIAAFGAVYTARTFAQNKREAARTFELNRRGQLSDRFGRAVDQLGQDEKLDVRLGGIYALERLAQESSEEHGPIMEVLCAYVRSRAPAKHEQSEGSAESEQEAPNMERDAPATAEPPELPVDIQAVMTVLVKRREDHDQLAGVRLDLRRTDLRGANAIDLRADGAHLDGADLRGARLRGANLRGAVLDGANLQKAELSGADLREAELARANLQKANVSGANLQGANLNEADLPGG